MSTYRLAAGTVDYITLTTTDDYIVERFPLLGGMWWSVNTTGVVSVYTQRVKSISQKAFGQGGKTTRWQFDTLSRQQVEWFLDTYAPDALTVPVTLMTWRFNNQSASGSERNWVAYTALMNVESGQADDNTVNAGDYYSREFKLLFTDLVQVT